MSDGRPNIVLVTVDSLRADHCGFMGYERDTTPTLDRMAEDGLVFENAIAPGPATPESMPAIFTGQYPLEREADGDSALATRRERIHTHMEARETLPERLSRMGYRTAAFTPNPFTSRHFGFDQGFDHFEDFMDESTRGRLYQRIFQGFLAESGLASLARVLLNFWQREEVFKPWESYYDDVVAWARDAEEPYFLWVFLMDAHNPYMSSSEYRTQSALAEFHANVEFWRQSHETPFSEKIHDRLVTAYDDSIRYSDAFLEQLRADLGGEDAHGGNGEDAHGGNGEDAHGGNGERGDAPVYVVHGDHGEAFGEHGTYGHEPYLYAENVHVPLIVDGVDSATVEEPISLRALPDVLGSIAAGEPPETEADAYVRARTRQGSRSSIHVPGGSCIRNGFPGASAIGNDFPGAAAVRNGSSDDPILTGVLAGTTETGRLDVIFEDETATLEEHQRLADVAASVTRRESL